MTETGGAGGQGGAITITCAPATAIAFAQTDLFTGGNIDVLLRYTRQVVFTKGAAPRLVTLFQRTGAMGGQGSSGQNDTHGGNGGPGGSAGAIMVSPECQLATPPAAFTDPPTTAPLIIGGDPATGPLVTTPRPRIITAFAASGERLYTVQAFGGGGGIPGGSAFSQARCSRTSAKCFVDGPACPLGPDLRPQVCLALNSGRAGSYGVSGADGPVSCGPLEIPAALAGTGLVCQ